jgi:hypothetical protein
MLTRLKQISKHSSPSLYLSGGGGLFYLLLSREAPPYNKVCKDNNLIKVFPKVAKEWHPSKNKNLKPREVVAGSHKKAWWWFTKGHDWEAVVAKRAKGSNCPHCYKINLRLPHDD